MEPEIIRTLKRGTFYLISMSIGFPVGLLMLGMVVI